MYDFKNQVRAEALRSLCALARRLAASSANVPLANIESVVRFARQCFLRDRDVKIVRNAAIRVLERLGASGQLKLVELILRHETPSVRACAIRGTSKCLAPVILCLADRNRVVRRAAASCVERLGWKRFAEMLRSRPRVQRNGLISSLREVLVRNSDHQGGSEGLIKDVAKRLLDALVVD